MVASGSIMDEPGKYISVNGARMYYEETGAG